jgi:S-adenosylmethionine hydrolase
MPLITLTTDFGHDSSYVAAMKGVIASINPAATVVDLTHGVPPQNILTGALVLGDTARWFPGGTIHLGVVDPGVGTERKIVCLTGGDQFFVGPDNGLFTLAVAAGSSAIAHEVTNPQFRLAEVSDTFHGRDVMAPAAAHLSLGIRPGELGPRLDQFERLALREAELTPGRIDGEVLMIDSFGNALTNITAAELEGVFGPGKVPLGGLAVACGPHKIHGLVRVYADSRPGTPVALIGSAGRLELAIVEGNAARELAIEPGQPVAVTRQQAWA